jgi:hypothetical protein
MVRWGFHISHLRRYRFDCATTEGSPLKGLPPSGAAVPTPPALWASSNLKAAMPSPTAANGGLGAACGGPLLDAPTLSVLHCPLT